MVEPYRYRSRRQGASRSIKTRQGIDQGYCTAHYIALTTEECELAELLQQYEVVASHAKALVSWSACDTTCRGLEHWASKSHWAARHEALDQVRDLRREMAKQNRRDTNTASSWAIQFAEYSRPSRIMARLLGHADELAAIQCRSEYTLQELEEIIAKEHQGRKLNNTASDWPTKNARIESEKMQFTLGSRCTLNFDTPSYTMI